MKGRKTMRRILCGASFVLMSAPLFAGDIHGRVSCAGESDSANAVVYVAKLPAKSFPAPKEHATIDQSNRVFQPHVLAVLAGTTVDFLNSDPYLHNVFAPEACADKFNLGTFGKGEKKSHTFGKECFSPLLCIVHPEMEGFVAVLPTPYFAVTSADGAYAIHDVPDGTYILKVWHPKLKRSEKSVTVHGATQADFQIAR
jgi:plastocyanin